jgi:hypothetical protein
MTKQWIRSVNVELGEGGPLALGGFAVGATDAGSLRMTFRVERDEKPYPNSVRVQIYNLSPDHRKYLEDKQGIPCRITAGYRESDGVIFAGMLREAHSEHAGADWITTIEGGDGELNRDGDPLASGSISKTWKRGTPLAKVVQDFVKELKVDPGTSTIASAAASLITGPALAVALSVDGPILDEMTHFMRSVGLAWSVQDSALQVRVADAPSGIAPVISPLTGLVGTAEVRTRKITKRNPITKKKERTKVTVCTGKCLLLPGLLPGQQLIVQGTATGAPALYLCTSVRHVGDTHGTDWYTEFEGQL